MMNYDKEQIKELILTDYLDGQLDEATKKEVEAAIARDPELREFLNDVKKTVREPFDQTADIRPPEHVWQNIKQEIEAPKAKVEEDRPRVLEGVWEWFKGLGKRPRLSFAVGSVMTVLIIFLWVGIGRFHVGPKPYSSEQQVEYLMFLAGGDLVGTEDVNGGFDTTIENYFL